MFLQYYDDPEMPAAAGATVRPPKAMKRFTKTCSGGRSEDLEDHSHYCAQWLTFPAFPGACDLPEFR